MEKIIWSDQFNTGSVEIDNQHRHLVDLINILIENRNTSTNPELLTETIEQLILFIEKHFADEERILKAADFPDVEHHQDHHLDFIENTAEQFNLTLNNKNRFPEELTNMLYEMWLHHMEHEIPEFRAFFTQHQQAD